MAHPGGRPEKFNRDNLLGSIKQYTENTNQPFIQEFCLNYFEIIDGKKEYISEDALEDYRKKYPEIGGAIKRLLKKQELFLVREGSANKINPTMAIFRLKQPVFGYTDKQEPQTQVNVEVSTADIEKELSELRKILEENNPNSGK